VSLTYPVLQLNLVEFEDMTDEHLEVLRELFEQELPALVEKYNERLVALTRERREGRPDVLVVQVPLLDYEEVRGR